MIVDSIRLKNFQCYAGESSENTFEFKRGLNLIIGDNGHGKSKLWDAFFWVLYDQIFQSDAKIFLTTTQYLENLISDKAKSECLIGEQVDTQVELVAQNFSSTKYRVTRMFRAKKIGDDEWLPEPKSILTIDKRTGTKWQQCSPTEHTEIINTIVRPQLKEFMWFQGEKINDLMDLGDKKALTKIIYLLSDIETYDSMLEAAKKGKAQSQKQYDSALAKSSSDTKTSKKYQEELDSLRGIREGNTNSITKATDVRDTAQQEMDKLLAKFIDAEARQEARSKIEGSTKLLEALGAQLDAMVESFSKNLIDRQWVLKNAESALVQFDHKYGVFASKVSEHRRQAIPEEPKLPLDVPQPIHVQNMITAEECFVCGREAKVGTPEHNHMKGLLSRQEEDLPELFDQDNSSFFQRIYQNRIEQKGVVRRIDQDVDQTFDEIEGLRSKIRVEEENKAVYESQMHGALGTTDDAESTINEYTKYQKLESSKSEEIRRLNLSNAEIDRKIDYYESELERLSHKSTNNTHRISKDVWSQLLKITSETRQRVFDEIIDVLEERANEIFKVMSQANNAITGKVKLEVTENNTCVPKIVDSYGKVLRGSNESNILLVKLSLIMAILGGRHNWSQNYTMIADGPTSHMADGYSDGFYSALSGNFVQSIVITYDFLNEDDWSRWSHLRLGNVYRIKSSHGSEKREDRHDLRVSSERVSIS